MGQSAAELETVLAEARPLLGGAWLDGVHECGSRSWFLTLRAGRRDLWLVVSLEPNLPRLHLLPERPHAPPAPQDVTMLLRRHLCGRRLSDIAQVSGDRVVVLSLAARSRPREEPRGQEDSAESGPVHVVVELFGRRPNLIIVDGSRSVIAFLEESSGRGPRWQAGASYTLPPPGSWPRAPETPAGPGETIDTSAGFPVSAELAVRYAAAEALARFVEGRGTLAREVAREISRRRRLCTAVEEDLRRSHERMRDREVGELLKAELRTLRRGMREAEVVDYFSPGLPKVRVELDAALSPEENVARYFRRYRKAKRAVPFLDARLAQERSALAELEDIEQGLASAQTSADIEALSARARALRPLRSRVAGGRAAGEGKRRAAAGAPKEKGARFFRSAEGLAILVGRSAAENDRLTFRIARGDDTFLHVSGRPGAHVVVRTEKGKSVPLETLLDAATLAVYYSLPERSRGALAAGGRGEVDYTQVKNVRKPRGSPAGLVLLSKHKTLQVRLDAARLDRLRASRGATESL